MDPENPQGNGSGPGEPGAETSIVNQDGSFAENWFEKYPKEDHQTLSRFKRVDDFVTSHMSQRKMLGKNPDVLVEIPADDAADDVKQVFYTKLGVPEDAKLYKYERSKDLSDKIDIDDEKVAAFAGIAKKYNLTQAQFNGVANDYLALIDKDIEAFELKQVDAEDKDYIEVEKALKKEWGKAFEDKVARANLLMRHYGGQNIVDDLGLRNSLPMVKLLDAIANDMSEDRIRGLTALTVPTPAEVDVQIAELQKKQDEIMNKYPIDRKAVKVITEQLTELYKKKNPEKRSA